MTLMYHDVLYAKKISVISAFTAGCAAAKGPKNVIAEI